MADVKSTLNALADLFRSAPPKGKPALPVDTKVQGRLPATTQFGEPLPDVERMRPALEAMAAQMRGEAPTPQIAGTDMNPKLALDWATPIVPNPTYSVPNVTTEPPADPGVSLPYTPRKPAAPVPSGVAPSLPGGSAMPSMMAGSSLPTMAQAGTPAPVALTTPAAAAPVESPLSALFRLAEQRNLKRAVEVSAEKQRRAALFSGPSPFG